MTGAVQSPLGRLWGGERDTASPAGTAIAPHTGSAPLSHVFGGMVVCSHSKVSSNSCISVCSSHRRHQHDRIIAQVNPVLLETIRISFYQVWKQLRLENCLWWLDLSLLSSYCLGSCLFPPSPASVTLHISRGQHYYSDKTEQSGSHHLGQSWVLIHALLPVLVSLLAYP